MGRLLVVWLAALTMTGCAQQTISSAVSSSRLTTPSDTPSPRSQPFGLFTHCGFLTTDISGRTFYLAELYPDRVTVVGNPEAQGTLIMLSLHRAEFVDNAGHRIEFVDAPPGQLNVPYPFKVHVVSGGNQLIEEPFAGRRWQTHDTLPGVFGPPYGNGQDNYSTVGGTFTLTSDDEATFKSDAGAIAHFTVVPPAGCD